MFSACLYSCLWTNCDYPDIICEYGLQEEFDLVKWSMYESSYRRCGALATHDSLFFSQDFIFSGMLKGEAKGDSVVFLFFKPHKSIAQLIYSEQCSLISGMGFSSDRTSIYVVLEDTYYDVTGIYSLSLDGFSLDFAEALQKNRLSLTPFLRRESIKRRIL